MEIKETVPFTFDEIYTGIEDLFYEKGYDAIYEGSNTAQLITAMTYLTSMLNANTAMNINEMLLPLAQKRDNILYDARALGYEIDHITSYSYNLVLTFPTNTYTIPKYTEFIDGDKSYYYLGDAITVAGGSFTQTIPVTEGTLKKFGVDEGLRTVSSSTIVDNETILQHYVDVPYIDVEKNGLEVFLTYYDDLGVLQSEEWEPMEQYLLDQETVLNKQYIRLDDIKYKTPRIYFKLGNTGDGLRDGTIIEINALISSGTDGAMSAIPTCDLDAVISFPLADDNSEGSLTTALKIEGAAEETSESIKTNAPLFYNAANRVVTKSDYLAVCNRHASIKETAVWGGEDEYPKAPGKIWFGFKPSNIETNFLTDEFKNEFALEEPNVQTKWFIEDEDLESTTYDVNNNLINLGVWDVLNQQKIPTLEFLNRHPIYIDFYFDINIMKYNIKTSKADIHQNVFDVIRNYFEVGDGTDTIEQFESSYFNSNLEKRIDTDLTDITGFNNVLTNKIMISAANVIQEHENSSNYDLIIPLAVPFESYFDDAGGLLHDKLPQIEGNFVNGVITVDWAGANLSSGSAAGSDIIRVDILLDGDKSGEYIIFNSYRRDIVIHFFLNDGESPQHTTSTNEYAVSKLSKGDFDNAQFLNLQYYSPNFEVIKNCIPRLHTVTFS